MILVLYLVTVFCYLVAAKNEEYIGYKVYKIKLETKQQEENLSRIKNDIVDFWSYPNYKYGVIGKAMVPPSHLSWFEEQLTELGITSEVFIENVYEYLTNEERKLTKSSQNNTDIEDTFDIKAYHRYDDILAYLRALQNEYANSTSKVELEQHGVTEQNRPLVYLKITDKTTTNKNKPIVVVEAGINPREWITIPASLNVVRNILEEFYLMENLEWIVIPVLNPDGYEYTHTNSRLWKKSRSTRSHLGVICPGVNLNRNFDIDWLHFDSSSSPCSHLYGGTEPFSEIETQMIRHIIHEHGTRIKLYISLQNKGGYISYPWNYERAASGMFRQHLLLGLDMIASMNENYNLDVSSTVFDRASGTSSDYARNKDILYTFNIDVVQRGDDVIIPEENIGDIVNDIWRSVAVAANEMIRLYS